MHSGTQLARKCINFLSTKKINTYFTSKTMCEIGVEFEVDDHDNIIDSIVYEKFNYILYPFTNEQRTVTQQHGKCPSFNTIRQ